MSDAHDLVVIYEAANLAEAKMLSDRLTDADIGNHIANVTSPLDGLTAGDQSVLVRVLSDDASAAREVVERFLDEHDG